MAALERRIARWVELVGDLLLQDLPEFPRWAIGDAMAEDFGTNLSWNWRVGLECGFEIHTPVPGWPEPEMSPFWEQAGLRLHPLIRWFAATGCAEPMSTARVPRSIAPDRTFDILRAIAGPADLEQQLSLPYELTPDRHRAFVLGRTGGDYSDEDLEVARRLQPLLMLLDRQVRVLGSSPGRTGEPLPCTLTGRERAVLLLLERGDTAEAIGRQLGISPRTVHKHLEHLYRKLGVTDRLRAVVVAREAGLLTPAVSTLVGQRPSAETRPDPQHTGWSGRTAPLVLDGSAVDLDL